MSAAEGTGGGTAGGRAGGTGPAGSARRRSYAVSGGKAPATAAEDIPGDGRRVVALDALRGFALLGILIVNALMSAGPYYTFGGGPDASGLDRVVAWLAGALVAGKFYLLFSFLFGYSFVLQERSARRAGVPFAPRHLRRTLALFALGLVHAVLLYSGDILMAYAVLALPLYGLRNLAPGTAVRVAVALVAGLGALLLLEGVLSVAATEPQTLAAYVPTVADTIAAHRGDFGSVLAVRLEHLPGAIGANILYAPDIFAAFLAGLAAARVRLLERRAGDRVWLRRTALRWLPLGLAGGAVAALCTTGPLDTRWFSIGQAVSVLTAPALTAAYVCGLLLLLDAARRPAAVRAAGALAASGRLALTHYLTQSLVLALVFTGYGAGLYDRLGTATVVAGCLVLYVLQLAAGERLTRRFRYGPAELLLRAVTLARRPGTRPDGRRDDGGSPSPAALPAPDPTALPAPDGPPPAR